VTRNIIGWVLLPAGFIFALVAWWAWREVSRQFLVLSPIAEQYIEACKRRIAELVTAVGPRGGLYRLTTPAVEWYESRDTPWAFACSPRSASVATFAPIASRLTYS
jgi:hypothetical protein